MAKIFIFVILQLLVVAYAHTPSLCNDGSMDSIEHNWQLPNLRSHSRKGFKRLLFNSTKLQLRHQKLSLQWGASLCNSRVQCTGPVKDNFTIHGLWPDVRPNCFGEAFNFNAIESLEGSLNESWPDVIGNSNREFWAQEWGKHGTCSPYSQVEYFKIALELKNKYDVYKILTDAQINPGGRYLTNDIKNVLQQRINWLPANSIVLQCNFAGDNVAQLKEIRICLSTSLSPTPVNCPASHSKCRAEIFFPPP